MLPPCLRARQDRGRSPRERQRRWDVPDGDSATPRLSADGRVIAFETLAESLLPAQEAGRTSRHRARPPDGRHAYAGRNGRRAEWRDESAALNRSGLAVAFTSDATNLAKRRDTDGRKTDVYLWRLDADTIERVSVNAEGAQPSSGADRSPASTARETRSRSSRRPGLSRRTR